MDMILKSSTSAGCVFTLSTINIGTSSCKLNMDLDRNIDVYIDR